MSNTAAARTHMIDCQLRPNGVNNERILAAIADVPREMFLPKAKRAIAYVDEDLEIAEGRYLVEPVTFARMLVAADIKSTDLVLDIGCASGYSSAVIAGLADAVVALEENEVLADRAESKLSAQDIMNVAVIKGDLCKGVPKQGPFDVIFLGGAVDVVPAKLVKQLKEGGRLVCVKVETGVGRAHIIEITDGEPRGRNLFDANVQQLPGFAKNAGFVF
ncbi:MAG: protein-L-isoaspartate O-methyltransferase [Kordiimonadaceae bacterium]|nr:protein-L-isoaspartate O-methyltransferase [Kordiimonadaceae bacterium]